jgi:AcrR family transcriptional regulator
VGIGTLYRHFPTRQALLEAILRESFDRLSAEGHRLLQSPAPADALARWLRAFAAHATTYHGLAAAATLTLLDTGCGLSSSCQAMSAVAAALLARAQRAGSVRPDADASDLLRLVNAIVLATERTPDGCARAERLLALVVDGLRCQQPPRPRRRN